MPHGDRQREGEALDALPHPVLLLAPQREPGGQIADLRIDYANAAAAAVIGSERDLLEGNPLHAVMPHFPPSVYDSYLEVLATGEPMRFRHEFDDVLPDGRRVGGSFDVCAQRLRDELLVTFEDVTEAADSRRAEAVALRESEERFRIAFERAPIGITLLDLAGRFVQVNDAYCRTVRRSREELLGRTAISITHPDDVEATARAIRAVLAARTPTYRFEKRYLDPAGEPIWVEISGALFRDAAGRAQFVIGQVQDVGDRRVAHVLQRSMLTTQLPVLGGLDVAVRYLPASADAEVGGDWYDLVELPGGRLGIAVGDVVGRGVEAAGTMSQLRTALRAYAIEGLGPADVLRRMHRLVDRLGEGLSTTAVLLDLDPGSGEVRYASAGHLPPAVLGADGSTRLLEDGRSTPLGTAPLAAAIEEGLTVLEAGETVLLYTDGLVERRDISLDERIVKLRDAMAAAPQGLEALLDHLLSELLGDSPRHDDVALLALRMETCEQEPLAASVGHDASGLATARAQLRTWLEEGGAGEHDVTDILLAAGEACANGVEHAAGGIELRARRHGAEVVIAVRDHGSWRRLEARADRGQGLPLMRLVMDGVRVVPTEEGTYIELRRRLHGPAVRDVPAPVSVSGRPAVGADGVHEQDRDHEQGGREGVVLVERDGGVPVARLAGEIDLACAAELRSALEAAVSPRDLGLVVDLGAVGYLDSTGLNLLHDMAAALAERGQRLRAVAPRDRAVARVLDLVGLERTIPLDGTVAQARAALDPAGAR